MSDVDFQSGDMLFGWDENKNRLNKIKHGISFETALKVFADENRIEQLDDFHSDDEDRWQVIGKVNDILFVVYTERFEAVRLITARKATAQERRIYYDRAQGY